jgi:hypothetical protein
VSAAASISEERPLPAQWRFNHVMSLGGTCAVSSQIKRCFGLACRSPFDLWYTPLLGLIELLSDNTPSRLYEPTLLARTRTDGTGEIRNTHYDIEFSHSFAKREGGLLPEDWLGAPLARFRTITDRAWAFLRDADRVGTRILFLRLAIETDGNRSRVPQVADLLRLQDALTTMYRNADFRIVLLNYPALEAEAASWRGDPLSRCFFASVNHSKKPDWRGPPEAWDASFAAMPASYEAAP